MSHSNRVTRSRSVPRRSRQHNYRGITVDITDPAQHVPPPSVDKRLLAEYWQNVELLFPGESEGDFKAEHHAERFIRHFFDPRHPARLADDGISAANLKQLFVLVKALKGRLNKIDIKVCWKRIEYPDTRDPELKEDVTASNLEDEVMRIVNAALKLQRNHMTKQVGYDYDRFFRSNTTFIHKDVADNAVLDYLAKNCEDRIKALYEDDQIRKGMLKYHFLRALGDPFNHASKDAGIGAYMDIDRSLHATQLDVFN